MPPGDPLRLAADEALQERRLGQAVASCTASGAQAVAIGGGPLAQSAGRLAARSGAPVISPVAAAMQQACRRLAARAP